MQNSGRATRRPVVILTWLLLLAKGQGKISPIFSDFSAFAGIRAYFFRRRGAIFSRFIYHLKDLYLHNKFFWLAAKGKIPRFFVKNRLIIKTIALFFIFSCDRSENVLFWLPSYNKERKHGRRYC
jgi:hypothetical protein